MLLTALNFWAVTDGYERFGGAYYRHLVPCRRRQRVPKRQ
jgi:hypothetical protein